MKKIYNNQKSLKSLHTEIESALQVIEQKYLLPKKESTASVESKEFSLLERCEKLSKINKKDVLRTVHHFACSGGTLISKCISSLPNVYLLSEVHPYTKLHFNESGAEYSPTDITRLCHYANVPNINSLSETILRNNIVTVSDHINALGGELVIRDHSHADFCVGDNSSNSCSILNILSDDFEIKKIATVRHPVDSYLSLIKNNWVHFSPPTFNEYCTRLLYFLKNFEMSEIYKYEDFVDNPKAQMELISTALDIKYDENFSTTFNIHNVTGDSGRKGSKIQVRERLGLSSSLKDEVSKSRAFEEVANMMSYSF
ncbi:sulfotransferase [Alteromonas sp. ASW11-19]|uniref:Sulfotransferase n=1 Tax=Alteromonas salexigens TaxID=2982530 RepID=A0ABT2VR96_9ALTE|nr:sulfotransferase [Alteromonas salexigens]MCU7554444.1 sulfotransferase [Alteromonas salexigens]